MLKSFENRDGWIWMNGKIIPWQDANSHVISQGLHYASAVFEGERAYNGKIFLLSNKIYHPMMCSTKIYFFQNFIRTFCKISI